MSTKCLILLNIYFFLNGIFKRVKFDTNISTMKSKPKYDSVIYIVLDALRYDYIQDRAKNSSHFLHNKMSKYNSIKDKFEALSVCGIPTSTTCRVTGLLTGTPSNFLEGIKTFLKSSLDIDNMVNQMYDKYKGSVSFFGDATWLNLCPILKKCHTYAIDPYSKKDLIINEENAITALKKRVNIDKAILCHLISLDSLGHIHRTTSHPELKDSLERFDNMINDVFTKMGDNTLLVLTSDHGVTDEGEHGGVSTHEMSSFVSFISKKPMQIFNVDNKLKKIRKNFLGKRYDLENNFFIKNKGFQRPYIVHQDDILPTVCYLLGVCVPQNVHGNVIHELVDDSDFLQKFYEQKCLMVGRKAFNFTKKDDLYMAHYKLSEEIYNYFSGQHQMYLIISFVISLVLLKKLIFKFLQNIKNVKLQNIWRNFDMRWFTIFSAIVIVSHSVGAIKNESLVWILTFLFCNTGLNNIILVNMIWLHDKTDILSNIGFYTCLIVYLLILQRKNLKFYILLCISVIKDFFPFFISSSTREIISLYPENKVLAFLIYKPKMNLILLILPYLNIDDICIYPLINLLSGLKDLEKIDYSVAYVFTDTPSYFETAIPFIFYFVYCRKLVKRPKSYFYINLFSLLCTFTVTYWEFDTMSFYFHFASRCFFVCLFCIIDLFN